MKTPLNSKPSSSSRRRSLALLASALGIVMLGTSGCTSCQTVGVSSTHNHGVKVDYDLPIDYLSGDYRQLYRTNPQWFHNHYGQGQGQTYYSK